MIANYEASGPLLELKVKHATNKLDTVLASIMIIVCYNHALVIS